MNRATLPILKHLESFTPSQSYRVEHDELHMFDAVYKRITVREAKPLGKPVFEFGLHRDDAPASSTHPTPYTAFFKSYDHSKLPQERLSEMMHDEAVYHFVRALSKHE